MRQLLPFFIFLITPVLLFGQHFGGNAPSVKWKQVNTDTVRVVFPVGLDSQAQRIATIVQRMAAERPYSLGKKIKKVNILLQNQTTIANGYAQLGPFHVVFYMTPSPNNFDQGSIGWADQLALHEYRHVQQYNNFNNGISKVLKLLAGEDGYSLAINAAIPDWFFEGDAVYAETKLTEQGRGRLPSFLNAFPALWQSNKKYSWMKLRNGSFKDYVPNHYELGYLLVNYGREKYGNDFWEKVTKDASAYKGLLYPFQKAIKKYSGIAYRNFRTEALEFYKKNIERVAVKRDEYLLPVQEHFVTNYYFPYVIGEDSVLYLKSSYRKLPAFYVKDAKGEHKIKTKDITTNNQFSYRNGKIVYAAYASNPRWGWKDYQVIKLIDLRTKTEKTITHHSKYFSPDISSDGKRIVAVSVNERGESALHLLNADNGQIIDSMSFPSVNVFTDPKFMDASTVICAIRNDKGEMYLAKISFTNHTIEQLTPASFRVLGNPCIADGRIYFTANDGQKDDIFFLSVNSQKIYKVTDGPLGNYQVNVANGKIIWSTFTADGMQLKERLLKDVQPVVVSWSNENKPTKKSFLQSVDAKRNFEISDYKKTTGLINLHSWRPNYDDPVFSYSIYGQNILNTFQTELFYQYNRSEKTHATGMNVVYGALFPNIILGTTYTYDRTSSFGSRTRHWNQLDTKIGLSIPLNYAKGKSYKHFNVSSFYVLRNNFNKGFYKDSLGNTSFSYLSHGISWSSYAQQAVQHIFPRMGIAVSAAYRHTITAYTGHQFVANTTLYLPGFFNTHNLILDGSFQQRDTLQQLIFANHFAYARGYEGRYFSRMWRLSANYQLPVLYPDWGFANILYLQRVRANLFYDFTRVYSNDKSEFRNQRSFGGELFIDTKWWNQYPLTFGFRISRLLDFDQFDGFKGTRFEFVLPVNIIPR